MSFLTLKNLVISEILYKFAADKDALGMRIKKNNGFWVLLALLSSFGMMIGFLVFNIDVIVFSVVPCFVSWCVVISRLFDSLYNDCINGTTYYDILDRS